MTSPQTELASDVWGKASTELTPASVDRPEYEGRPGWMSGGALDREVPTLWPYGSRWSTALSSDRDLFRGASVGTGERAPSTTPSDTVDSDNDPEAERRQQTNDVRLQLLARKYAYGNLSTEEQARLQIVTQRLSAIIRPVTVADVELIEQALRERDERTAELEEELKALGVTL